MNTKDLYLKYGVMLRKRHTKNQKLRFLSALEQEFINLGFETSIRTTKHKMKDSYSLYVGDFEEAKTIIATTYDTPLSTLININYEPFNDKRKQIINFVGITLPSILVLIIGIILVLFFRNKYWTDDSYSFMSVLGYIIIVLILVLLGKTSQGFPRMNNFYTNTSSIVEIIKYAQKHKKHGYVFTDYGTQDNFGYLCLKDALKKYPDKNLIFVDSIGNDTNYVLKENVNELKYNSLSEYFPNSEVVSSGRIFDNTIKLRNIKESSYESNTCLLERIIRN